MMKKIDWKKQYLKHPLWMWVINIVMVTLITILFAWLIIRGKFTGELFKSVADIDSPELFDLYSLSADNVGLKNKSDVVLIPVDGCSRIDVINILKTLHSIPVAVIGVDISFPYPESEDSEMLQVILSDNRIVMASLMEGGSYFEDDLYQQGVEFGSIQLDVDTRYDVVRTFVPAYAIEGDTIWSFDAQLARKANPDACKHLKMNESAYIAYSKVRFDTIPAINLLERPDDEVVQRRLRNKIVILGDMEWVSDTYRTSIQPDMPGMVIHAYTVQTILQKREIHSSPVVWNWLFAFVITIFFSWMMLCFKWKAGDVEGLALRIVQLILMCLVVVFGVLLFCYCDYYFNMEPVFFALALQALALDLWVGIMGLFNKNDKE